MLLIDDYDADDLKSMADNNSSAFNYRLIEGLIDGLFIVMAWLSI